MTLSLPPAEYPEQSIASYFRFRGKYFVEHLMLLIFSFSVNCKGSGYRL
jgi:hypothetical protein